MHPTPLLSSLPYIFPKFLLSIIQYTPHSLLPGLTELSFPNQFYQILITIGLPSPLPLTCLSLPMFSFLLSFTFFLHCLAFSYLCSYTLSQFLPSLLSISALVYHTAFLSSLTCITLPIFVIHLITLLPLPLLLPTFYFHLTSLSIHMHFFFYSIYSSPSLLYPHKSPPLCPHAPLLTTPSHVANSLPHPSTLPS